MTEKRLVSSTITSVNVSIRDRRHALLACLCNLPPHDYPSELLCDEAEILDLIVSLDPLKSTGPDGVSVKMLRGTTNAVVSSLTKLFSISLSTGKFPKAWKEACCCSSS